VIELARFNNCESVLVFALDFPAGLELADPGGEVKVLGGVPLPFVLGGKGAGAACESKYAGLSREIN
jgi:hypothetical protein